MNKAKKVLSVLLAVVLLFGTMRTAFTVWAGEDAGMTFTDTSKMYISDKKLGDAPKTYEAVVRFPANYSGTGGSIIGTYHGSSEGVLFAIGSSGKPALYIQKKDVQNDAIIYHGVEFSKVNVYTGEWVHITIVHESEDSLSCYINGEFIETSTRGGTGYYTRNVPYVYSPAKLVIGGDFREQNTNIFRGEIKSVALYSEVRTAAEVAESGADFDHGEDNLIVKYDLTSMGSDASVIPDLSNNGMDARYQTWVNPEEYESVDNYDYSFAVVGDTQCINDSYTSSSDTYSVQKLEPIYEWIRDNAESKKMKYVLGLGDITEHQLDAEYQHAKENIQKLDGVVPYSLVRGNHDNGDEKFTSYFSYDAYTSQFDTDSEKGGRYDADSLNNVWRELIVGDLKYLILALDIGPSDDVLAWASDIIEAHPKHNVIITTHVYLFRDGTTLDGSDFCPVANESQGGYNNGDDIWEKLVKKHENIVMVLSGHDSWDDIVVAQTPGDNGNVVTEMLIDPQGMDKNIDGGVGMVAMFYFSEGGSKIEFEYYSTIRDQYWRAPEPIEINVIRDCYHENTTSHEATEATCTTKGHEAYTSCDDCGAVVEGSDVEIPMKTHTLTHYAQIDATPIADGCIEYWECSVCDQKFRNAEATEVVTNLSIPKFGEELKFADASVTLGNHIFLSLKVDKDLLETSKYEKPFVKFILNHAETVVTEYTVVDNQYVFDFGKVAPHQMNDTVYAILCAYSDGKLYSSTIQEYSVGECCYNMLEEYKQDEKTRTLLVDLLNYGAAAQTYRNYDVDNLVNTSLTATQKAWASAEPTLGTVLNKAYTTVENPTVTWKSVGLNLKDSVTLRFKIATDSVESLSLKVTNEEGEIANIYKHAFEKIEDGFYYVYFGGLTMTQMCETIYVTIYNGETAVSNTLRYSIESYAYMNQSGSNGLGDLMKAMMKVGTSATAYIVK